MSSGAWRALAESVLMHAVIMLTYRCAAARRNGKGGVAAHAGGQ